MKIIETAKLNIELRKMIFRTNKVLKQYEDTLVILEQNVFHPGVSDDFIVSHVKELEAALYGSPIAFFVEAVKHELVGNVVLEAFDETYNKWSYSRMKDDYDKKSLQAFRNDLFEFDKDYNAESSKEKLLLGIFDDKFWLPGYRTAAVRMNKLGERYYNIVKLRNDRFYWMSESNFDSITPFEFEELISELLNKMGYETEVTSKSGDYGIDVIARKGKDVVAVQAKKYSKGNNVGNQEVQKLLGSMQLSTLRANKGILATTSDFTVHAIEQAKGTPIEFWNGEVLAELFNKYYKDGLEKLPADLLKADPIDYVQHDIVTFNCPKCNARINNKATKCKSCKTEIMWLQDKPQIKPDFLKGGIYGCIGIIIFIACVLFLIVAFAFIKHI